MNATLKDFAALLLRLWLGLNLALAHGLPKLSDTQAFLSSETLQSFPLPVLSGWFAMLAEGLGGALLALGLFTRPAAAAVAATMLGAGLVAHAGDPWVAREFALTYAVVALYFLVLGGGVLSADERLRKKRRSRSPW